MRALPAVAAVAVLAGCRNPCQRLCDEMAAYAEECGFTVSDEEIDACHEREASRELSDTKRQVCADEADALRDEWTCDDLRYYFEGGGGDTAGGGDDTGG